MKGDEHGMIDRAKARMVPKGYNRELMSLILLHQQHQLRLTNSQQQCHVNLTGI